MPVKVLTAWAKAAAPDDDGAVSVNKDGGYINVGFQRESVDQIPAAVLSHNAAGVESSLNILKYAFSHQRPDGSFVYGESNGRISSGAAPSALGEASSAAFFLYDAGHSLLLLHQSPWFQNDPALADARKQAGALERDTGSALSWLMQRADVLDTDRAALNRRFVYAAAYILPGMLLHRGAAVSLGERFLRDGLAQQQSDGTLPESGGFDSSYQAVSLYLLQVLYLNLPQLDSMQESVANAVQRGIIREISAIEPGGTVSTDGNTRVTNNGEQYFGHTKKVDSRAVILALAYDAAITNSREAKQLAQRVFQRYH